MRLLCVASPTVTLRSSGQTALTLGLCLGVLGCERIDTIVGAWQPAPVAGQPTVPLPSASASSTPPGAGGMPDSGVAPPPLDMDAAAPSFSVFLEAEAGELSGPIQVGNSAQASGSQFITSSEPSLHNTEPGAGRALFRVELTASGDYIIWARMHGPSATQNRFWVRADAGAWTEWRLSTGEEWFWDDVHQDTSYNTPVTFPLSAGSHTLEFATADTGAELDRLYLTSAGDRPPVEPNLCSPPHSVFDAGQCVRSCGSYGDVTCDALLCDGQPLLDVYDCPICCLAP